MSTLPVPGHRERLCRRGSIEKGARPVNGFMLVRIQSSALVWKRLSRWCTDRIARLSLKDPKGFQVFREERKACALALALLDGNGTATSAKDLGLGIRSAVGGYAYDQICCKDIEGSVFDV